MSIASVTLAHNSAKLLPKQLEALHRQSRPLEEIIVVNNGSTDMTGELLSADYPQVTVLNLPSNLGVGAGYAAGLVYAATEKKHDWVWLLDHDSLPREDGLEKLLQGMIALNGLAETIAILAPMPTHSATKLSYGGLVWKYGFTAPPVECSHQQICFVDAVISSGSLIRREIVETVGLPRADFFIDFVDFEYCLRVRRHGYRIAMVRDSLLEHSIGDPRTVKILGYSKSWTAHAPWREYYLSRNYTFMIWDYHPDWRSKLSVLRWLLRHAVAIIAFGECKGACLHMMLIGFFDGLRGRLGIRFLGNT